MPFNKLGLSASIVSAITKQGYSKPTPIQLRAIPAVLSGNDVIAAAQTGTGKTAAFTLPLLERLITTPTSKKDSVRALIITPTRELAAQIHQSVETYGSRLPLRSSVIFGGVKINPQIKRLKQGSEIVIATPGRLLDLVNQRAIDLSHVETLVLDEADRMLDMGFIHDIRRIIRLLPKERQSLLFSATFSTEIKTLANKLLRQPQLIEESRNGVTAKRVSQMIYPVDKARKRELISYLIGSQNWEQVLIFTRTKRGANRLAQQLETDGLTAAAIHGNKSQGARTRALAAFKSGEVRVLVATDIAARGLDIDKLPHVVNYDLPNVAEDYVHRIGRTGRAENEGLALSLVSIDEQSLLRAIEKLLKNKIPQKILPGFEPDPSVRVESSDKPSRPKRHHPARRSNSRRSTTRRRGDR